MAVELPDGTAWTKLSDQRQGTAYQREWIPAGSRPEDAAWLIVEQRLPLAAPTTAGEAISTMQGLAREACTAVAFEGPEDAADGAGSVGRIHCAHRHGSAHGTVTDQRVVVDGATVYVVTSELRTPPSPVPGVFPFETEAGSRAFMERMAASAAFVRESVRAVRR